MIGTYLAFQASGARYAIPLDSVREAARLRRLTPLPGAPERYAGVTMVRGEAVGVLDVARAVTAGAPAGSGEFLIVLDRRPCALRVDRVDGPEEIDDADVVPADPPRPPVAGTVAGERSTSILDLELLLGATESP